MNIVDQIYYDLYTLVDQVLLGGFLVSMGQWRPIFTMIATIAMALIGYQMMYGQNPNLLQSSKQIAVILVVYLMLLNPHGVLGGLKFMFIEFPIAAGQITISGITGGLNMSGEPLDLQPTSAGPTAFGAMWDFTTSVAQRMFGEANWRNVGPYFWGGGFYVIGFFMVVVQLIIMISAFLLSTAVILGAPVFGWMILFKQTKPMFEKWLSIGMTSAITIFMLIVVLGILLSFLNQGVIAVFNIDMFDPASRGAMIDPEHEINFKGLSSVALFLALGVKILPNVESWGRAIGGVTAGSISEAAMSIGSQVSDKLGLGAAKGAKKLHEKTGNTFEKINEKGSDVLQSVRDRMMTKRMNEESQTTSNNNGYDAGFSSRGDNNSLSFDDNNDSRTSSSTADKSTVDSSENADSRRAETSHTNIKDQRTPSTGEQNDGTRQTTVNQGDKVEVNNKDETTVKESDKSDDKQTVNSPPKAERQENINQVKHQNTASDDAGQKISGGSNTEKRPGSQNINAGQNQSGGRHTHTKEIERQTVTKEDTKSGNMVSGNGSTSSSQLSKQGKRQDSSELRDDKHSKSSKPKDAKRVESKELKDD